MAMQEAFLVSARCAGHEQGGVGRKGFLMFALSDRGDRRVRANVLRVEQPRKPSMPGIAAGPAGDRTCLNGHGVCLADSTTPMILPISPFPLWLCQGDSRHLGRYGSRLCCPSAPRTCAPIVTWLMPGSPYGRAIFPNRPRSLFS